MANSNVAVTEGSGKNVDTRTTATDGDHRQVVVVGDPSVDNNVVNVVTADPGASSTTPGVVMRLAGSASVQLVGASSSIGVYFDRANPSVSVSSFTGSVGVYFDRANPTVTVASITNTVGVYFDRSNPSVNVGTPTIAAITNTVGVYFDRGNPSVNVGTPTVAAITASVGVYFDRANPSVNVGTPTIAGITNSIGVYFDRGTPAVNVAQYGGAAALTPTSGIPVVNTGTTMSIFTVTGSTSTVAYNTLVSPSASYSFKVYAYAIQTTGAVSISPRFTTGASAGATELWRPLVTASGVTGVQGANLAVSPPGYLFATGTNTTLNLYLDAGTLVHYSVSYIKESA